MITFTEACGCLNGRRAMSLPDEQLDEPQEPERCTLHEFYRPCPHCADDEADRQHDEEKERPA